MTRSPAEVFIVDATRRDGSRFTLTVRSRTAVRPVGFDKHVASVRVSHWIEDVPYDRRAANPTDGWRLNERYAL